MVIRVGVLGFGQAGRVFHAPVISRTPGLHLAAIATSQTEAVTARHPTVRVDTPEDLLAANDIDVIVVATPNDSHVDLALRALDAGKAVIVDKPMATSVADAQRLIDHAARRKRLLTVFHNRRWDDDFLTLKQTLSAGVLGSIVSFESHFDRYRPQLRNRWRETPGPGSGLWWDLGSHLVDQAIQILGVPKAVTADLAMQRQGGRVTDYAHVILHYGSQRAILHAGCLEMAPTPRLRLQGNRGSFVTWGLDPQEQILAGAPPATNADRYAEITTVDGNTLRHRRELLQPGDYGAFYRGLRDAMTSGGPVPVAPEEALQVTQVIEAAEQSAKEGRTVAMG